MNLLRWFRIGVVGMACLGALALGTGEYQAPWVLGAVPLCLASVYLCDARRHLVLGTTVANVLGVVAMIGTLWNFDRLQQDQQLVSLGQLLVALQCILFYRPKNQRLYWMLILLSLLEFQVASIVHSSLLFGALTFGYLGLGAVVLCLFHLITCRQEVGLAPRSFWPAAEAALPLSESGKVPRSRDDEGFSWGILVHLGWLGLFTLLTAPVLFFLVPRHGQNPVAFRPVKGLSGVPVTGFSNQVRLGELGRIVQNPQQVMRIQLLDADTFELYPLQDPPLLQGVTLWNYSGGSWSARGLARLRLPGLPLAQQGSDGDLVLIQVHLEPLINSTVIFVPRPVFAVPGKRQRVFYDFARDAVRRRPEDADREFQCRLLTTAFRRGKLRRFIPATPLDPDRQRLFLQLPQRGNGLQRLRQLALQVTAPVDNADWVERARTLERFLKSSGRYRYTLSPPRRGPELDPIEDFLFRQRAGHCEYFASALALMLRACGIPSRMIVGFKPREFNPVGGYYVVRQQDAHTWVHAYVPREKLPPHVASALPRHVQAVWMLLDPTPGNDEEQAQADLDWSSLVSFVYTFWNQYIVRMDAGRQRRLVEDLLHSLGSAESKNGLWQTILGRSPVVLAFVLLVGLGWIARRRAARWLGRSGRLPRAGKSQPHPAALLLHRLERVLNMRLQRQRRDAQTPREFVEQISGELEERFPQNGLAEIPARVVDRYYRARFGNRFLSAEETRQIEQWIAQLDRALQNGKKVSSKAAK